MDCAPITLIVNADDFGLSRGINRAILACCNGGILRSTSLMPNGAAFAEALEAAARQPNLGVGIHLSLVGERCVAPPASLGGLVDADGLLPASYPAFVAGYLRRRFGLAEIRTEIDAQLRRVFDAGLQPTHLDSHQHLHLLPGVREMVIDVARAAGIRALRIPHEHGGLSPHRWSPRGAQLGVLGLLCPAGMARAQRAGLRVPDHFWGLGVSGALTEAALLTLLQRLRPGVNELMCHPGDGDTATQQRYAWGYQWEAEAAALQAPAVRALIGERGIRLATFADAWEQP